MSDHDSFIDEVTEEVRRDKLFALMRRYGWIGIVAILAIVGGAAWTEWQRAQTEARAQAFGTAVLAALADDDPAARLAALGAVEAEGGQAATVRFLAAGEAPAPDMEQAVAGKPLARPSDPSISPTISSSTSSIVTRPATPRFFMRAHRMSPKMPASMLPIASTTATQPAGIASIAVRVEIGLAQDAFVEVKHHSTLCRLAQARMGVESCWATGCPG